jgi:multidrug efflux pump subunit AcrB
LARCHRLSRCFRAHHSGYIAAFPRLGTDIFPRAKAGQLQVRIRAASGTQLERTLDETQKVLGLVKEEGGLNNLGSSLALVGVHGSAYPINFIYQWGSGPHESVLQVELKPNERPASAKAAASKWLRDSPPPT